MTSEQTAEIAAALAKAQGAMTVAKFNRVNPHFHSKFADLASVIEAIRKPLSDNGIAWTQVIEDSTAALLLYTTLLHTSGQWISGVYPLPTGAKPQEFGSALTYAKRYSLSAICGIAADEDDDAEAASKGETTVDEPVTQSQIDTVLRLVEESKSNVKLFLEFLTKAYGADAVEKLPRSKFPLVVAMLERKVASRQEKDDE